MSSEIRFTLDDQEFVTQTAGQRVADLLDRAGLTAEQADLVTPDGVAHNDPEEPIAVHDGDRFEVRRRGDAPARDRLIHYEVNGERQTTSTSRLTVGAILERAGRAASIDIEHLGDYYLQDLKTGRRYDDSAEEVIAHDGDRFLAVHRGATPVA
jgi:uncharacterized protein YabE (DUF348 family)